MGSKLCPYCALREGLDTGIGECRYYRVVNERSAQLQTTPLYFMYVVHVNRMINDGVKLASSVLLP